MYFGDEDPALISDQRKTLASNLLSSPQQDKSQSPPPPSDPSHSSGRHDIAAGPGAEDQHNRSDLVLMYNVESGCMEYCSVGSESSYSEGGEGGEGERQEKAAGKEDSEESNENPLVI